MNLFHFKDNAMFLSCWHERNRPVQLICYSILIVSILILLFLNIVMHQSRFERILENLFFVIATSQAFVLLLAGTFIIGSLAGRERSNETLDFHRNSPQPELEKIAGLVFGGTWFEWMIFAILFAVELPFALLPNFTLANILLFNLSLIMTGILFHTTAAVISLISPQKKRASPFAFLLLFLLFCWPLLGFLFAVQHSNFFMHFLGITAIKYIHQDSSSLLFTGWFLNFHLPLIVIQALCQLPLTLLMIKGMKRIFSQPNSPVFAKVDVIRFSFFILFMFTGFFVTYYLHFDDIYTYQKYYSADPQMLFLEQNTTAFLFLFSAIGFIIGFLTVPSYFKRTKIIILRQRKDAKLSGIFDDGATSFPSILIYLLTGSMCLVPYYLLYKTPWLNVLPALIILYSHILAFAGFLEYFRLGRFRGNKIFFATVLIAWWALIPWLAAIIYTHKSEFLINAGSLSPFIGIPYVLDLIASTKEFALIPLIAPSIAAVLTWFLAWQEHRALRTRIKN